MTDSLKKSKPNESSSEMPPAPAAKKTAKPAKTVTIAQPVSAAQPAKVRMERRSYSMSAQDHALVTELKKQCRENGLKVKKGELLSVALSLLAKLTPAKLTKTLNP